MSRLLSIAKSSGRDFGYVLGMLVLSVVDFAVWMAGLTATASLLVLVVGFLVWLVTAYAFRLEAAIGRRFAGWYRRSAIQGVYREPSERGLLPRLRTVSGDPQTWKDLGWLVISSILGFGFGILALTATAVVIGYIVMPVWWWAIPDPHTQYGTLNLGIYTVTSTGWAFVTSAIGLVLLPLAMLLGRGVATAHSALAAKILGASDEQRLKARVSELASTRSGAVEAAQEQLERIERDLHDGAQARLVALAMELGMAEEDLTRDPEAARTAVRKARDEALVALSELRDLSRGLRPALLEERGLLTAIDALAQRSALPVSVSAAGQVEDVPEAVKTAAYFVVAEALTNAVKHSDGTATHVALERTDSRLLVTVSDDGAGGANQDGAGLAGLGKRTRALDGRLEISSPPGGPTVVRAEFPCE